MTGPGGWGRDLLAGRNRILPGWHLSGHFPRGNPPGVATLQCRHVEAPVLPMDDRLLGAVLLVSQRGFQEALVVVGGNTQVQGQLEA